MTPQSESRHELPHRAVTAGIRAVETNPRYDRETLFEHLDALFPEADEEILEVALSSIFP